MLSRGQLSCKPDVCVSVCEFKECVEIQMKHGGLRLDIHTGEKRGSSDDSLLLSAWVLWVEVMSTALVAGSCRCVTVNLSPL